MKMLSLFNLVAIVLFLSCNNAETKKQKEKAQTQQALEISQLLCSCDSSQFYKTISSYVNKYRICFLEDTKVFFSAYFFEKNNMEYFTMWSFIAFPDYLEFYNDSVKFDYSYIKVGNEDVVLVRNQDYDKCEQFYQDCKEQIIHSDDIKEKAGNDNYDGRWYIETYKYYLRDGEYVVEKLDTPIVDFRKNLHEQFY